MVGRQSKREIKEKNYTLCTNSREKKLPVAASGALPTLLGFREVAGPFTPGTHKRRVTFRGFTRARRRASPAAALSLRGTPRRPTKTEMGTSGRVGSDRVAPRRCVVLRRVMSRRPVARKRRVSLSLSFPLLIPDAAIPQMRFHSRPRHFAPGYPRYVVTRYYVACKTDRRPAKLCVTEGLRGGGETSHSALELAGDTSHNRQISPIEKKVKKTLARTPSSHSPFLHYVVVSVSFDVPARQVERTSG